MANLTLDLLDRKIAHALRVDGRVPFSTMATVLDVSDQTVARRYRRMRSAGALQVLALPDPYRLGQADWLVRLQCAPGAAVPTALALGRRPDTAWVSLTSGGTEVLCFTGGRADQRDLHLLGELPRAPHITAISAQCMLRLFRGGTTGWTGRATTLTQHQIDHLRPPGLDAFAASTAPELGPGDEALLTELARDGRASYTHLAKAAGWSESATQRRLEHLRRTGVIYFEVDIEPELFGCACEALVWLSVPPAYLDKVGAALAGHPEVGYAAATTGHEPRSLGQLHGHRCLLRLPQWAARRHRRHSPPGDGFDYPHRQARGRATSERRHPAIPVDPRHQGIWPGYERVGPGVS